MRLYRCFNRHGAQLYWGEHASESEAWTAAFNSMHYPLGRERENQHNEYDRYGLRMISWPV